MVSSGGPAFAGDSGAASTETALKASRAAQLTMMIRICHAPRVFP